MMKLIKLKSEAQRLSSFIIDFIIQIAPSLIIVLILSFHVISIVDLVLINAILLVLLVFSASKFNHLKNICIGLVFNLLLLVINTFFYNIILDVIITSLVLLIILSIRILIMVYNSQFKKYGIIGLNEKRKKKIALILQKGIIQLLNEFKYKNKSTIAFAGHIFLKFVITIEKNRELIIIFQEPMRGERFEWILLIKVDNNILGKNKEINKIIASIKQIILSLNNKEKCKENH